MTNNPYAAPTQSSTVLDFANENSEAVRRQYLNHEMSIKSVGALYFIGSILLISIGVSSLASESPVGLILIVLAIGQFCVGIELRKLRKVAKIPVGILSGIGLLGFPLGTIINGYILYLVFSEKGNFVFSDEYQQIIAETPYVKKKTSPIVVAFLIILVALLLFILVGAALK
jgi:hypothetical protein